MEKCFLLVVFLNDNHLGNVVTLQSIYRQTYNNIKVVFCNDATNHFQREKFVNNMNVNRPQGIQQVKLVENPHRYGETRTFIRAVLNTDADYVMVLHSGEQLLNSITISRCAERISLDKLADVLSFVVTQKDETLTEIEATYNLTEILEEREEKWWKDDNLLYGLKDCMFVYRRESLLQLINKNLLEKSKIAQTFVPAMLTQGMKITNTNMNAFFYLLPDTMDVVAEIPDTLGDPKLETIRNLYAEHKAMERNGANLSNLEARPISKSRKQSIRKLLFRLSRRKMIIAYAGATLLLAILSVLLFLLREDTTNILGIIAAAVAGLSLLCTLFMLGVNLYYRLKPERLLSNE